VTDVDTIKQTLTGLKRIEYAAILRKVVLPEPEGPVTATNSPAATS